LSSALFNPAESAFPRDQTIKGQGVGGGRKGVVYRNVFRIGSGNFVVTVALGSNEFAVFDIVEHWDTSGPISSPEQVHGGVYACGVSSAPSADGDRGFLTANHGRC
jgi:hypothetical protein